MRTALLLALAGVVVGHDPAHHAAPPSLAGAPASAVVGRELALAAGAGARAPRFVTTRDGLGLSWLEPAADGMRRLRFARLATNGNPAEARTIAEGKELLVNAADTPSIAEAPDGALIAQWLVLGAAGYGVELAQSKDAGATWSRLGPLHDDPPPAGGGEVEHGFVSLAVDGKALRAVWLDGRETVKPEGATTLRTALVIDGKVEQGGVLDNRVCDCCPTAMAATPTGPLVVYRDRDSEEVRDIAIANPLNPTVWRRSPVHVDGWKIAGCPVNGPAVATSAGTVWVVWFTRGSGSTAGPRVLASVSSDGGSQFASPRALSGTAGGGANAAVTSGAARPAEPLGHVDLIADGRGGALAAWLETEATPSGSASGWAVVRLARLRADGTPGTVVAGPRFAAAGAGTPRLAVLGEEVLLAWTDDRDPGGIRVSALSVP